MILLQFIKMYVKYIYFTLWMNIFMRLDIINKYGGKKI